MKKKVLLSVFAASLFAAPAALAAQNLPEGTVAPGPTHFENEKYTEVGTKDNHDNDFKLTDVTQKEVNDKLTAQSVAKTKAANDKKAPAKKPAGQRALPKTSAVK